MKKITIIIMSITLSMFAFAQKTEIIKFPVTAEIFVDEPFKSTEGIAFNGLGDLYVTANKQLWKINFDGSVNLIAELYSNLGIAAIGEKDLLVADFGPTNAFRDGKNHDGIIWRITPEGGKVEFAKGIGDPNAILVKKNGDILVSDDATNEIFTITKDGQLDLFCTAVNHPNGMVLSNDESTLYVAQIFKNIKPVIADNRIWAIKLDANGQPVRGAKLVTRTDPLAANDGLAMDENGKIYIAANRTGKIWRYDPESEFIDLIAEHVYGAASIAFGQGDFDHESIYVTTGFARGKGGKIYKIPVGVKGAALYR